MISNDMRETLHRVCSVLNKYHVDYILVGGVAVAYHGYLRVSGTTLARPEVKTDLDFWYNPMLSNFVQLSSALVELGVSKEMLDGITFDPKKTFLKIPHSNFHTDFLCQLTGLSSFSDCKTRASKLEIDGNSLLVLSYNDLLINKESVNRLIDKDDLKNLRKKNTD
ncbi:MAG TPA: hypothetical protein VD927_16395 [Chryseosolibacter sp.]|nr:hypothetical protein [Chryseosolibacter sp.]